ncbi:adenosine deaminase 2-like [Sitophilus oryzae]|uniref:Adenosine deaminase n=1 Tax=Sitophilus oryzae TaxID=7048 RepID=A0A6J2XRP6_SITOR|nr:adenosine deaminase 2-like [Sitophilus oryzae]
MSFKMNIYLFLIYYCVQLCGSTPISNYLRQRENLIRKSQSFAIGSHLKLDENEVVVNEILMEYKKQELWHGFNPKSYLAGKYFTEAKEGIERSCVYKIIQKLPKGANLHCHDEGMVSADYIFNNLTHRSNLYVNYKPNHPNIKLRFLKTNPGPPWFPIETFRTISDSFDVRLKESLTIARNNSRVLYSDIDSVWKAFQDIFPLIQSMINYKSAYEDFLYQALLEQYEDNIKYVEVRLDLSPLYDLKGTKYTIEDKVKVVLQVVRNFQRDHLDFWGAKLILSIMRGSDFDDIQHKLEIIKTIAQKYPGFVVGIDLIGQKDLGKPLINFLPQLMDLQKQGIKFFFHAGETLWNGEASDQNLYDAILLNTSRIGHGYAVTKHPEILRLIKEKSIPLEISPISNQILGLVKDLRNHPANFLIANNYPLVITSDDPAIWNAQGLSFDWYMTFMAMTGSDVDLKFLKQLAMNSIIYSSMTPNFKQEVLKSWNDDWEFFLREVMYNNVC